MMPPRKENGSTFTVHDPATGDRAPSDSARNRSRRYEEYADVVLVAPPDEGRVSGGFLVNRMLEHAPGVRGRHVTRATELAEILASADPCRAVVVDSLYLFEEDTARVLVREAARRRIALLAHSLPSLIPGPSLARRRTWLQTEHDFLKHAAGAIAPSRFMCGALARRGLPPGRCRIVEPAPIRDGRRDAHLHTRPNAHAATDPDSPRQERHRPSGASCSILTIANWGPAKGVLEAALALRAVSDHEWRWTIVGNHKDSDPYVQRVREVLRSGAHRTRTKLISAVAPADIGAYYRGADLFLLPSYVESYGLVYAEALSYGVPVVAVAAAAVPSVVGEAGLLVPPAATGTENPALAGALRTALADGIGALRRHATSRAARLPTWTRTEVEFLKAARQLGATERCP